MTKQNKMPDKIFLHTLWEHRNNSCGCVVTKLVPDTDWDYSGHEYIKKSIYDEVKEKHGDLNIKLLQEKAKSYYNPNSIPVDKIEALIEDCEKEIEANYNPKAFGYDFVDDLRIYEKYFKELQTLLPKKDGE